MEGLPQGRIANETHLLNVEALLANEQPVAAAQALSFVLSPTTSLSADLFAKFEHISGRALASSEAFDLARVHLERAVHAFTTIGHSLGKEYSLREHAELPAVAAETIAAIDSGSQRSIDRIRALMDLRTRPELFGHEAASLLKELRCAATIDFTVDDGSQQRVVQLHHGKDAQAIVTAPMSITFDAGSHRTVTLSFVPLEDPRAKLTALSFHRVVKQILAIGGSEPAFASQDIVWTANEGTPARHGVIFGSDSMLAILRTVKQIAPTDVSVLVTGETGTGKEVIAKTIHEYSRRSAMPFLPLNCAAVPKDLLESQLFGHRKGAFSGAAEAHQGVVRAANGGTLFLDEIGEIPIDMQAKLLRFLEMSEVHPVGESHPVKVNVRLIFATNGDLEEAVSQNRFRQDLFYRLNVIPIKVPPLRERREEIPVLANLFAQRFAAEFAKDPVRFSSNAMELLILHAWPGNIRQLANEVRRLTALAESGACIAPEQLSPQLQAQRIPSRADARDGAPQMQVRIDQSLEKATADLESEMIKHALRQAGGRMSAAASTLGISRKGLYLKRLRLGLIDFDERAH
jgi:DNA-binding NtrC family response regulator